MITIAPWDHRESIVVALERFGLNHLFHVAISRGRMAEAAQFLCSVGADAKTADTLIEMAFPARLRPPLK